MVEEKKEQKTRQRLTLTAMYEAITDLYYAVAGETARAEQDPPALVAMSKWGTCGKLTYAAGLFQRKVDEPFTADTLIEEGVHPDGIEEAVAALLAKMQEKFEAKRRAVLADLDSVRDRHHGALRGARSKIKEKKT